MPLVATPCNGCQKDHVGWVKAQFYVLNFQLEILEWLFLLFLSTHLDRFWYEVPECDISSN